LIERFDSQYTKAGKAPKLESIYGIALYDPKDGKIVYMHRILNMEGASPLEPEKIERELLEFAKKELNYDITKLNVLHDPNIQKISGQYQVDVIKKTLVKIEDFESQKKSRI
jgi:hypothetical protein